MVARSCFGVFVLLVLASPAAGRIWLDPNAQVPEGKALVVTIEGLAKGQKATVTIQDDCGSGGAAPRNSVQCPPLWGPAETAVQEAEPSQRFTIAADQLAKLPKDRVLWVVVEAPGWARPAISRFHRADPCATMATIVQSFAGGPCGLALPQVLSELTRSVDVLNEKTFEVQRVGLEGGDPKPIPGTRGATGVAWAGQALLVTTPSGVSRVDLNLGTTERLASTDAGEFPTAAPLALPDNRIAFVRQAIGPQRLGDAETPAELVLWPDGRRFPLPYKVHQLLASNKEATRILALSLGLNDAAPLLFEIDLATAGIDVLGFDSRIYQAMLREPHSPNQRSVVAFEEVRSGQWRIGIAEGASYKGDLKLPTDRSSLAPAWRADGSEIAFLAEVKPEADSPKPPQD